MSAASALCGAVVYRTVRPQYGPPTPPKPPPDAIDLPVSLDLFVLAGQSNMVGTAPIADTAPLPGVYCFGNDYQWKVGSDPLDSAENQVDAVSIDRAARAGPGLPFAARMKKPVGLIPCAKSSKAIAEWRRSTSDQTLYGSMLKRFRAASVAGTIRGLLFFQGEADARTKAAEQWAVRFSQFVAGIRGDTIADLAIVFAQIGADYPSYPYWATVKAQQASIDLPRVSMIRTDDLALQDDGLHFTPESYDVIGGRFADAMLTLLS